MRTSFLRGDARRPSTRARLDRLSTYHERGTGIVQAARRRLIARISVALSLGLIAVLAVAALYSRFG